MARKNQPVNIRGKPYMTINRFTSRNIADQEGMAQYMQSAERKKFPTNNTLSCKVIIHNWKRDKEFPRLA